MLADLGDLKGKESPPLIGQWERIRVVDVRHLFGGKPGLFLKFSPRGLQERLAGFHAAGYPLPEIPPVRDAMQEQVLPPVATASDGVD